MAARLARPPVPVYRRARTCVLVTLLILFFAGAAGQREVSLIAPLAERSLLLDGAVAGEAIVVVGERGHVLKSLDNGVSWRQIEVPTRATLTAVSFLDSRMGFIVGHDAVILRTQDGGDSWQRVYSAPEEERPLLDVYAAGPSTIVAVGAYGFYVESTDGGSAWQHREFKATEGAPSAADEAIPAEDLHLNQIRASATGRWYIAAEAGTVYRSDDQGAHWLRLPSPYEGSFFGVLPLAGDRVLLYGLQGRLFESRNAGGDWGRVATGTEATLTDALVLREGGIVVAGYAGTLLIGRRGLADFILVQLEQRTSAAAVLELAGGDLLLLGSGGMLRVPVNRIAARK